MPVVQVFAGVQIVTCRGPIRAVNQTMRVQDEQKTRTAAAAVLRVRALRVS